MRRGIVFQMGVPHREPMRIRGFEFGNDRGVRACAIVGSTRGNEVQQTFICARLVAMLANLERDGMIDAHVNILVLPCVNPFSMNVHQRFWPVERSDINRSFPGDALGGPRARCRVRRVAHGLRERRPVLRLRRPHDARGPRAL